MIPYLRPESQIMIPYLLREKRKLRMVRTDELYLVYWKYMNSSVLTDHLLFCLAGYFCTAILLDTIWVPLDHAGNTVPSGAK